MWTDVRAYGCLVKNYGTKVTCEMSGNVMSEQKDLSKIDLCNESNESKQQKAEQTEITRAVKFGMLTHHTSQN